MKTYCLIALLSLSIILTACAPLAGTRMDVLDQTLRAYHNTVRWGQLDKIATFHKEEETNTLPSDPENIKVSRYVVIDGPHLLDKHNAIQFVEITYYRHDGITTRTIRDRQTWQYQSKRKRWFITSKMPKF